MPSPCWQRKRSLLGYALCRKRPTRWDHLNSSGAGIFKHQTTQKLLSAISQWLNITADVGRKSEVGAKIEHIKNKLLEAYPAVGAMLKSKADMQSLQLERSAADSALPNFLDNSMVVYAPYQYGKSELILAYAWIRLFCDDHLVMILLNNITVSTAQFEERDLPAFRATLLKIMQASSGLFYNSAGDRWAEQERDMLLMLRHRGTDRSKVFSGPIFYHGANDTALLPINVLCQELFQHEEYTELWRSKTAGRESLNITLIIDEGHDAVQGKTGLIQRALEGGDIKPKRSNKKGGGGAGTKMAAGGAEATQGEQAAASAGGGGATEVGGGKADYVQCINLTKAFEDVIYVTASPTAPLLRQQTANDSLPHLLPPLVNVEGHDPTGQGMVYKGLTNGGVVFVNHVSAGKEEEEGGGSYWRGRQIMQDETIETGVVHSLPAQLDNHASNVCSAFKKDKSAYKEVLDQSEAPEHEVEEGGEGEDNKDDDDEEGGGGGNGKKGVASKLEGIEESCFNAGVVHALAVAAEKSTGLYIYSHRLCDVQSAQGRLLLLALHKLDRHGAVIVYNGERMQLLLPTKSMGLWDDFQAYTYNKKRVFREGGPLFITEKALTCKGEVFGMSYWFQSRNRSKLPVIQDFLSALMEGKTKQGYQSFTPVLISQTLTSQSVTIKTRDHQTVFTISYVASEPAKVWTHMETL